MSFIAFAWIASFFYALTIIVGKLTSKYAVPNPWMYEFFWELFTLLFMLPVALFSGVGMPTEWGSVIWAGFTSAAAGVLYVQSLYRLDVSVLGPLYNFRTPMTVLLAVLFVGELLSVEQLVLIGIVTVAGIFVSFDEHMKLRSFFRPRIGFALLTVLASAIMGLAINRALQVNGFWEATLWIAVFVMIFLLPTIPLFVRKFHRVKPAQYTGIVASSLVFVIGLLAFNKAVAQNISITTTIVSLPLSLIITFILSMLVPKLLEKHTPAVYIIRLAAALVMVGAALRLSV